MQNLLTTSLERENGKGFTLVELLIVIAILGLLAAILVVVLNPAEMLRRTRDTQRISDLGAVNNALATYVASASTVEFDESGSACVNVFISHDPTNPDKQTPSTPTLAGSEDGSIDGTGWLPVDTSDVSVIPTYPLDPTNTITATWEATALADTPTRGDFYYTYQCDSTEGVYKLSAPLESQHFTQTDTVTTRDGGVCDNLYEVGSNLSATTHNVGDDGAGNCNY